MTTVIRTWRARAAADRKETDHDPHTGTPRVGAPHH
jgi:hypothetical protein